MARKEQVTLDTLLKDPRFMGIKNEALKAQELQRFVAKYPEAARDIAQTVPINPDIPPALSTPEAASLPHGPLPIPSAPQPMEPASSQVMSVLGNIASRTGKAAVGQMAPGGIFSPEAQMSVAGGVAGAARGGARFGPYGALLGGILGSGALSVPGRMYEWMTSPGEAPASLGAGVTDLADAARRNMTAEALSMSVDLPLKALGNRFLRPAGRLSDEAAQSLARDQRLGLLSSAGTTRESAMMSRLEELPANFPIGSKPGQQFLKEQAQRQEQFLLDRAEKWSPGATKDYQDVGKALFDKKEVTFKRHMGAASDLFERSKNIMGPEGRYAITNFTEAANDVVGEEAPLRGLANASLGVAKPFSALNPIEQVLSDVGWDPTRVYKYEDLLKMEQALGRHARAAYKNRPLQRQITQMRLAVLEDVVEATKTAGKPEAGVLVQRGKEYYRNFIIPVYDDSTLMHSMAKNPSRAAKILVSPSVPIEELRRFHKATAGKEFDDIRGKWYEQLFERGMENGQVNSRKLLGALRAYDDEKLKVIAGSGFKELKELRLHLERVNRNQKLSNRSSLAVGQVMGLIATAAVAGGLVTSGVGPTSGAATTAAITAAPVIIGRLYNTPKGRQLLTIGLRGKFLTPAGTIDAKKWGAFASKLSSEIFGLGLTRPGALGQLGFPVRPEPMPAPTPTMPLPASTPGPVP